MEGSCCGFLEGILAATLIVPLTLFLVVFLLIRLRKYLREGSKTDNFSVGFFHPYCLAGGGGERVLWAALRSLGKRYPEINYVIYTGDSLRSCAGFRSHVLDRFKINIPKDLSIEFVHLKSRTLLEAHHYPVLTMFWQSAGSFVVGLEALLRFCPDIYIDTTGHAFTFPLFRFFGGCDIAAYVHYPTISTDMLLRVRERRATYNNAETVSRSGVLSSLKVVYYNIFAWMYGMAGRCCDVTLVNSTWTYSHIKDIWKCSSAKILYPPCNVTEFLSLPLLPNASKPKISIVSIGQFRPEKDHALQIKALAKLVDILPENVRTMIQLDFVGSCRNAEDEERVSQLQQLAEKLNVLNLTEFHLNAPFPQLLKVCQEGTVGIHTMWNEHFGIGVVECMAAGLITVAHDSGGPRADIIVGENCGRTGYLARDKDSYAKALKEVIMLSESDKSALQIRARKSVTRFTDEKFDEDFSAFLLPLFIRHGC